LRRDFERRRERERERERVVTGLYLDLDDLDLERERERAWIEAVDSVSVSLRSLHAAHDLREIC